MVIQNRLVSPDWSANGDDEYAARCLKFPPRPRDPETGETDDAYFDAAREALPICNGDWIGTPCPVRDRCLLIALVNNDQFGVFGGMTVPQRQWIRRNVTDKELWKDGDYLREETPGPDYFKNYGDEDDNDG